MRSPTGANQRNADGQGGDAPAQQRSAESAENEHAEIFPRMSANLAGDGAAVAEGNVDEGEDAEGGRGKRNGRDFALWKAAKVMCTCVCFEGDCMCVLMHEIVGADVK